MEIHHRIPFILHIIVETPAALTFIFRPEAHLQPPISADTALICQLLGGAILTLNLICLAIVKNAVDFDEMLRLVALSLGFWHLWPIYRATTRLMGAGKGDEGQGKIFGGPLVHLTVHTILCAGFWATAFG